MRARSQLQVVVIGALLGLQCSGSSGPSTGPDPVAAPPRVEVRHLPVVARSTDGVTFSATLRQAGSGPTRVEIRVNAALVETCTGMASGDVCEHAGGPYGDYEGTTVSYLATAIDSVGATDTRGHYYFAITDADYNWALNYLPARRVGDAVDKLDLVFHRDNTYSSFTDFVDDVGDKLWDVYGRQPIVEDPANLDKFNFYLYPGIASSGRCGVVAGATDVDIPFRDADAVLHTDDLGDCTIGTHFTAEGHDTKAFLHESGHAVFDVADEYDDSLCRTGYFEAADEPNIFDLAAGCQAEQSAKGRGPGRCRQFTACRGGWWGIHASTDRTVMVRGIVGDPWGLEADEKVRWVFAQYR